MKKGLKSIAAFVLAMPILHFGMGENTGGTKSKTQEKPRPGQASSYLERSAHRGKVIHTMNSGGYTYIEFEEEGKRYWAAAPEFEVKAGDDIAFKDALPMSNFTSKTLNRTFNFIYFIKFVKVGESHSISEKIVELPKSHVPIRNSDITITVEPGSIEKAENGFTITECYSKKNILQGKTVKVRGRVVKFTSKILGRNWIHIQDGTGQKGTDDLTVTTAQKVRSGNLILVSGKLRVDKNFGAGYIYPVIIEDAAVTVERENN